MFDFASTSKVATAPICRIVNVAVPTWIRPVRSTIAGFALTSSTRAAPAPLAAPVIRSQEASLKAVQAQAAPVATWKLLPVGRDLRGKPGWIDRVRAARSRLHRQGDVPLRRHAANSHQQGRRLAGHLVGQGEDDDVGCRPW